MVQIQENVSLKSFNTFGINAYARYFCAIQTEEELQDVLRQPLFKNSKQLFLGGGSNILFTKDFDGLIIKNEIKGIDIVSEDEDRISIKVNAGEIWHHVVMHCVQNDWGGIENLSLIPGTVGAAPIQNIGAYGVEVKEVIEYVEAIELNSGEKVIFTNQECCFGYRESIFKNNLKEKFFISSVTLTLTKKNHRFNIHYGAIKDLLAQQKIQDITLQTISETIMMIRRSKLPDPALIGNAGSFFKNPTITYEELARIQNIDASIPYYTTENQNVKIPAGWLIEHCGWKGKRMDNIGVHQHQALVLVNYGDGDGDAIYQLANMISSSVKTTYGITLSTEVNII
jgi:UDP-N-acetylmuramate dehydrogenase